MATDTWDPRQYDKFEREQGGPEDEKRAEQRHYDEDADQVSHA